MSSRHTRSFFGVMLAVVFALSAVIVAPASAKLTKHQKAHIRKQLKRAIHKNLGGLQQNGLGIRKAGSAHLGGTVAVWVSPDPRSPHQSLRASLQGTGRRPV